MNRLPLLTLAAVLLTPWAHATRGEIPPADQLFKTLRPGHPRLLAGSNDWMELKVRVVADPRIEGWVASMRDEGEELLTAEPSSFEIPDGKRLLATSRRVLDRVRLLACLWKLDQDRRWADRAWQELDAAASFKDWNPSHFLDTAEMTHAFAIGYDWLYDAWTDEQRNVLQGAMVEKGLKPALKVHEKNGWWTRTWSNWNQVCNGGIGMGALALAEVEPELSSRVLHASLNSIRIPMKEFAPDGASIEGPGYWGYLTRYTFTFIAGLESSLGTNFGLSTFPGVAETGWFPIYMTGPLGLFFNYADSREHLADAPQLLWLAERFEQTAFAAFRLQDVNPTPLDLLWYRPINEGAIPAAPLGRYFRSSEAATLRGSWTDPNTTFVGFKAGRNDRNHGHLDIGNFVIDAEGERWAMDFGRDDYNLPGYFGGKRWNYYRLRAEGHNTLVINPGKGPDQVLTSTPIVRFESTPDRSFAIGDLATAYAPAVRKLQRGVRLIGGRDVLIQDELAADAPVDLWWFMHTQARIAIQKNETRAVLSKGQKQMTLSILEPARARFEVMQAKPLPSSPDPDRQANNRSFQKLGIHLPGETQLRLVVMCSPTTDEPHEETSVKTLSLEQW